MAVVSMDTRILRNICSMTFKLNLGEALTLDLILDRSLCIVNCVLY